MNPRTRLETLFKSDFEKNMFKEHLRGEFSVENFLFYESVSAYKQNYELFSDDRKRESINFIYGKYIQQDAEYQVFILNKFFYIILYIIYKITILYCILLLFIK